MHREESDTQGRQEAAERLRMVRALGRAAAALLTANDERFEESLEEGMGYIASYVGANRVYIWQNIEVDGDLAFTCCYRYLDSSWKHDAAAPAGTVVRYGDLPEWHGHFTRGECVSGPVSMLSEKEQALFRPYGVKSVCLVPIHPQGRWWGFVSYTDCRQEREFTEEDLSILRTASLMMTSALTRRSDQREQTQMMGEIEHRGHLLDTVNSAANILLNSQPAEFMADLHHCMGMMAGAVDADRVYIWKNYEDDGRLFCTQIQEWSEGAEPQQDNEYTVGIPYDETIPEWEEILSGGGIINDIVRLMSPESQRQLSPQGILSIFVAPVFLHDKFWGFVGFDDCHSERYFTGTEESILRSGCLLIASAFLRNEMTRDILAANEQMERALEEAKAASKSKSDFLSNMSHEIRTPMNAVIGMTELLLNETLGDKQRSYAHDIYTAAGSLLDIINDILDMSKIESGKLELHPTDYDFNELLSNIVSMFQYMASTKGIDFRFEAEGELPGVLFGDDIRLRQILTNICGNAIKFTQKGHVRLKTAAAGGNLVFTIEDTGVGIRKEDMPKLFSAFMQADLAKNRNIKGTGLGLAISKSFVEMMGGSIMVKSKYGVGTEFTINVPTVEGDREKIRCRALEKGEQILAPEARVLVVDDNVFNLKVARGLLGLSKIEAETAQSGKEAIAKVREGNFDIVFMDHMMPEMDGVEAAAKIRALGGPYGKLAIIALTANAIAGAKEMFLQNGFNGFVSKPIDLHELNMVLAEFLPPERLAKPAQQDETPSVPPPQGFMGALRSVGIDTAVGLQHLSGMEYLYREIVADFAGELANSCDAMSAHMQSGDLGGLFIAAHTIKSALGTIGATELSAQAAELEQAAQSRDAGACAERFPGFLNALQTLHGRLSSIVMLPDDPV
ncbi:MAG: response regulator [Oscillospiraceae bacterium]|jgi:signal transduction histidine kinase/CheY-like chemotaxis protein|nr:response regulator [Oscillospiraceae bacterium]